MPPGEAKGSGGGLIGYICDARLDAGKEFWRDRDPDAGCVFDVLLLTIGRGEGGTEFRSGAMVPIIAFK